jgi:hypothetical protein
MRADLDVYQVQRRDLPEDPIQPAALHQARACALDGRREALIR